MFREEKEELTRLQEALLEESEEALEEEFEEEPEEEAEEDLEELEVFEEFNEDEETPEEKGVTGLLITALLLTLGIVGVALWVLLEFHIL